MVGGTILQISGMIVVGVCIIKKDYIPCDWGNSLQI